MAIGTGDGIWKFGTLDSLDDGTTSSISDTAYSTTTDVAVWTNDDDAPHASFVLTFQFPSGTIDTNGIQLFATMLNNNGTTDEPATAATWQGHFLGNFATAATGGSMVATTNYTLVLGPVELPVTKTSQEYQFYFKNDCGVTISANWQLDVIPMAIGPKA